MIGAASFPAVHPQMQLVMSFEADTAEQGKEKHVEVQFSGPDGQRIVALNEKVPVVKGTPGYPVNMAHILTLNGLRFERQGDYVFNILVNGDLKGRVSLMVRPTNKP